MEENHWNQVNITYPSQDRDTRELEATTHLSRVLPPAEADGWIALWFFLRKGPWRVRYILTGQSDSDPVRPLLTNGVNWTQGIYEPETHAFGGRSGMRAAHELFHTDSHHLLAYLGNGPDARRERSLVLCTALMRAAGLDFNEQGDVWAKVALQRATLLGDLPDQRTWQAFTGDVRHLLTGQARQNDIVGSWTAAFEKTGTNLRTLQKNGRLTRGIRAVIALHVIFHWNRLGLPGGTQALLARAAQEAVFGRPSETG